MSQFVKLSLILDGSNIDPANDVTAFVAVNEIVIMCPTVHELSGQIHTQIEFKDFERHVVRDSVEEIMAQIQS